MILTLMGIVKTTDGVESSSRDGRFKIIKITASYRGDDGHEYRKSFEGKDYPVVPERGTHDELNKVKFQY